MTRVDTDAKGVVGEFRLKGIAVFLFAIVIWLCTASGLSQQPVKGGPFGPRNDGSYHRLWEIGVFGTGGFAPKYEVSDKIRYQEELEFYNVGVHAGRMLTTSRGPGLVRGRAEALVEILPFWAAHAPSQENVIYVPPSTTPAFIAGFQAYTIHGVSFTPLVLRWNFMNSNSKRYVPWIQAGAGVLWTTHNFPQGHGRPGTYTSIFNFTPQVGVGENLFVKKNQSLDIGFKAINYNNEGLGEINPAVPYTLQFSLGYSWWK